MKPIDDMTPLEVETEINEREAEMLGLISDALAGAVCGIYGERAGFILIVTRPNGGENDGTRLRVATNLCREDCAGALQVIASEYPARHNITPTPMDAFTDDNTHPD